MGRLRAVGARGYGSNRVLSSPAAKCRVNEMDMAIPLEADNEQKSHVTTSVCYLQVRLKAQLGAEALVIPLSFATGASGPSRSWRSRPGGQAHQAGP